MSADKGHNLERITKAAMTEIDAVLDDANVSCDILRDNLVIDTENNRSKTTSGKEISINTRKTGENRTNYEHVWAFHEQY